MLTSRPLRGSDRLLRRSNWLIGSLVDKGDRESGVRLREEKTNLAYSRQPTVE
jgi:hypothetical protein